uniref:Uncharacterized protein n=1 Tax=Oryza meridionalis TaxID=40149 RepID=A0A0E0DAG1_9ORYZ
MLKLKQQDYTSNSGEGGGAQRRATPSGAREAAKAAVLDGGDAVRAEAASRGGGGRAGAWRSWQAEGAEPACGSRGRRSRVWPAEAASPAARMPVSGGGGLGRVRHRPRRGGRRIGEADGAGARGPAPMSGGGGAACPAEGAGVACGAEARLRCGVRPVELRSRAWPAEVAEPRAGANSHNGRSPAERGVNRYFTAEVMEPRFAGGEVLDQRRRRGRTQTVWLELRGHRAEPELVARVQSAAAEAHAATEPELNSLGGIARGAEAGAADPMHGGRHTQARASAALPVARRPARNGGGAWLDGSTDVAARS